MHEGAFAGDESFDAAFAGGGEAVSGLVGFAAGAATRNDKPRVDDGTSEGNAFVDGLFMLLMWVKFEFKFVAEIVRNDTDITEELFLLLHGDDDEEIVDVATVMLVTEVHSNETIELVEVDIGDELAGEITNDDTMPGAAIEEAFAGRKFSPFVARAADDDVFHRVVIDNLEPEEFHGLIEFLAVAGVAVDMVLGEVAGGDLFGRDAALELTVEPQLMRSTSLRWLRLIK